MEYRSSERCFRFPPARYAPRSLRWGSGDKVTLRIDKKPAVTGICGYCQIPRADPLLKSAVIPPQRAASEAGGSLPAEPMVRRLSAGGRWIRTFGPRSGQRQAARNQIFRETTGAKHTNKAADRLVRRAPDPPSRNLPPSPFLYRHRRARRTVQLTFVTSIHNPKIMLRMLGKGSLPRLDHH